ncbi:DUF1266 domain-containing protein [Barnesiella viscericola]|uniref:DUF1266 domain-containing protein n=1 Tax=Barnesiella viscericola TaxID=397865 RepID=UPI0025A35F72|nr:DUF1266 domain-containing protein [Barnesiella viscericola]MDM8269394.1 DUF1266 domain-containing protein [Barnesiella viscericola]
MSNEFYIMLTIAVVSGGIWIYKKGKSAIGTVRKLRRAFTTVCLNPRSTLSDEQCRKLAVGALYASQQGAYQNSLETGIRSELPKILGEWWGITCRTEAVEELQYLCEKGYRYYFPFVWQAFLLTDPKQQDEVFQQNMTSQEDYDKITVQLQNLQDTCDELLACKVIAVKDDLRRYGVTGWDAGRICFLARACCEMGYITETEAWQYVDVANELAHGAFSSWRELALSYVIGRSLWGGKRAYNSVMKDTADKLLADANSPWVKYPW